MSRNEPWAIKGHWLGQNSTRWDSRKQLNRPSALHPTRGARGRPLSEDPWSWSLISLDGAREQPKIFQSITVINGRLDVSCSSLRTNRRPALGSYRTTRRRKSDSCRSSLLSFVTPRSFWKVSTFALEPWASVFFTQHLHLSTETVDNSGDKSSERQEISIPKTKTALVKFWPITNKLILINRLQWLFCNSHRRRKVTADLGVRCA